MKLSIPCMQCGFPRDGAPPDFTLYSVPVRDDGVYEFTCCRGHKRVTVVQQEKFEILFEIAMNAIVDGYYRDAVASVTSSLERFYEFVTRVICHAHKISSTELGYSWNQVKNMSERQVGMFIAAHLLHFGKAPPLMPSGRVGFRNEVIHKGRIPSKEEAVEYANDVLGLVMPLLIELKKTMLDSLQALTMELMKERTASVSEVPLSTMSIISPISLTLSLTEPHPTSVTNSLRRIEENKFRILTRRQSQRPWLSRSVLRAARLAPATVVAHLER